MYKLVMVYNTGSNVSEKLLESLSMTFTTDGKRQRVPRNFYSLLVVLK